MDSPRRDPTPRDTDGPTKKRGRVLVVDDEVLILAMMRRILAPEHDVVLVSSGEEAVEVITGAPAFDAVICDLMMPGLSGAELYEWIATHHPTLVPRMVFVSGGVFTPNATKFLRAVPNPRLDKPVDIERLRTAVRDLVQPKTG